MRSYIARQPIFNSNLNVVGYELLYRAGMEDHANITDGDQATRSLLSDAMMVFGMNSLTDGRPAFVNFTENLLLNDFVLLANPRQIVVEVLESTHVTERLIHRLRELKARSYRLVLDDYTGNPVYDQILPLMDMLKVDFLQTDEKMQEEIAKKYRRGRMTLLAEKVEDRETFERARCMGYQQFQGYFFERPTSLQKDVPDTNGVSYIRLLRELNKSSVDLLSCARIIRTDAALTYRLLKKVRTMRYYRGNSVQSIGQAVAYLGIDELYHWVVLLLARDVNRTYSNETVREAYLRGIFTEQLMESSRYCAKKSYGFLLGMFSLMEQIMNKPIEVILEDIELPAEVINILLNQGESPLKQYLDFAVAYERDLPSELPELNIDADEIVELYVSCIKNADWAFSDD